MNYLNIQTVPFYIYGAVMNQLFKISFLVFIVINTINAQSFKVEIKNPSKFTFSDKIDGNQITFASSTPLEDFTGSANSISGDVSFNQTDFSKSLKGTFIVKVNSINTGIGLRNKHLRSKDWLDEQKFPDITFVLNSINDLKQISDNKLSFKAIGNFTLRGKQKEITAEVESVLLAENEQTKKRAPGDLFGLTAKFVINLSDFGVNNNLVGNKVAEKIEVNINLIGSNKL
jgi:polyisoprenoid-binding protein YceI